MNTPIDQAVDRFLCWKLPENFAPDCGISFKRESDYDHPEYGRTKYEPTGTNLLDAQQAKAMLEHVTEPMLAKIKASRMVPGFKGGAQDAMQEEISELRAYLEEVEEWLKEGEELHAEIAKHSFFFWLGAWWADRPWRVRE